MKRALLLIVVPALLIAMGFAQTPPASSTTDQASIKGCLGGSDGNYTVVDDKTGHTFKITTSSVDLKAHVGHDVTLTGPKASGASSAAPANTFAVTEVNMISEHCVAAVAVAPAATISTLPETPVTTPADAAAPAVTVSTPAEIPVPSPDAAAAPAATVTTPAETAIAPAVTPTPLAETVVTPPVVAATPAATVTTPVETAVIPAAPAAHPMRMPAQRRSATHAAAIAKPVVTASKSSEPVITPDAAVTPPVAPASPSPETASTPDAAVIPPAAPSRGGSIFLLIAFAVVVIILGIMAPSISRWRKQKRMERTGAQNLSFNREASSHDQRKSDPGAGKAA
jgi:hypothetical protein